MGYTCRCIARRSPRYYDDMKLDRALDINWIQWAKDRDIKKKIRTHIALGVLVANAIIFYLRLLSSHFTALHQLG